MTSTAAPAVIDALLAALRSAAPAGIEVYDGIWPTDAAPSQYLMVGVEDADDTGGLIDAVTSQQEWRYVGHETRDETLTVHCVAVAWTGEDDLSACRLLAADVVTLATDLITADPSLSDSVLHVQRITGIALRQGYTEDGVAVNIRFDIECQGLLA
jgi:hypothetical protein